MQEHSTKMEELKPKTTLGYTQHLNSKILDGRTLPQP